MQSKNYEHYMQKKKTGIENKKFTFVSELTTISEQHLKLCITGK